MPPNFETEMQNSPKKDYVLNDTKTTTTVIEVFREKLNEARNPIDYLRLPAGPLDGHDKIEVITVHGPKYQKLSRFLSCYIFY